MEAIKIILIVAYLICLMIEVVTNWKAMTELQNENDILKAALRHEKEKAYAKRSV